MDDISSVEIRYVILHHRSIVLVVPIVVMDHPVRREVYQIAVVLRVMVGAQKDHVLRDVVLAAFREVPYMGAFQKGASVRPAHIVPAYQAHGRADAENRLLDFLIARIAH